MRPYSAHSEFRNTSRIVARNSTSPALSSPWPPPGDRGSPVRESRMCRDDMECRAFDVSNKASAALATTSCKTSGSWSLNRRFICASASYLSATARLSLCRASLMCRSCAGVWSNRPRRLSSAAPVVPLMTSVSSAMPPTWNRNRSPSAPWNCGVCATAIAIASPTAPRRPPQAMNTASCQVRPEPMLRRKGNSAATTTKRATLMATQFRNMYPQSTARMDSVS
mmetsp:Transcript_17180/g.42276  ORF Transcript_17180/g.42276 Transcript_17180/m.42276 type:complete len:224 (+) Transcript_17180:648-1319(+)